MCQSFQGHNREITKVMSILCVRKLIKVWRCSELWHVSHICIWSRPLLILPPSSCQVVCYPGSTWIFSASRDKTVLMWDLNQGDEPIQEFCGHELVVNGVAISPGTHRHTHILSDSPHLLVKYSISYVTMPEIKIIIPNVYCYISVQNSILFIQKHSLLPKTIGCQSL